MTSTSRRSGPVVLVSAGIGATPVLAMLHALAASHSEPRIWWLHVTRDARAHAFGAEVGDLIEALPTARQRVFYTAATEQKCLAGRRPRVDRRTGSAPRRHGVPVRARDRSWTTCAKRADGSRHRPGPHSHRTVRRPTPDQSRRRRRAEADAAPARRTGRNRAAVSVLPQRTSRSTGRTDYGSILELAEACDVPTRYSCRSGVCHICVTPLIEGAVNYGQQPLELPPEGTVLICSAEPGSEIVLDL